jgi:hypothetical protein
MSWIFVFRRMLTMAGRELCCCVMAWFGDALRCTLQGDREKRENKESDL